jgi:predicted PurR-regulated permease PerM
MGDNSAYTVLAVAVVGVLASCVGGLIWVIKTMFNQIIPLIENGNKTLIKVDASQKANIRATKANTIYLRERNGRDAEFQKENIEAIRAVPQQIIESAKITAKILARETHLAAVAVKKVKTDLEAQP